MSGPSPEQKRQHELREERQHMLAEQAAAKEERVATRRAADPGIGGRWQRLLATSVILLVLTFIAIAASGLLAGVEADVLQQISASAFLGVGGIWTLVFMQAWRG